MLCLPTMLHTGQHLYPLPQVPVWFCPGPQGRTSAHRVRPASPTSLLSTWDCTLHEGFSDRLLTRPPKNMGSQGQQQEKSEAERGTEQMRSSPRPARCPPPSISECNSVTVRGASGEGAARGWPQDPARGPLLHAIPTLESQSQTPHALGPFLTQSAEATSYRGLSLSFHLQTGREAIAASRWDLPLLPGPWPT